MFVKKYEAPSLEQALALVKDELGPNALILSTHEKKGKWFQKSLVEVTAAFEKRIKQEAIDTFDEDELRRIFPHRKQSEIDSRKEATAEEKRNEEKPGKIYRYADAGRATQILNGGPGKPSADRKTSTGRPEADPLLAKSAKAKGEGSTQGNASRKPDAVPVAATTAPVTKPRVFDEDRFEGGFLRLGFSPESAKELSRRICFDYPEKDLTNAAFVEKARLKLVATHLRTLNPDVFQERASWTAVGLSGSGKTSLLVKLAIMLKTRSIPSCLVGVDKRKVLARGELSAYARLIGVPYIAESSIDKAEEYLQLVDSPALSFSSGDAMRRLEEICRERNCIVVVDALGRLNEILRVVEKAKRLNPVAIAFTRLDLAYQHGIIYDVLRASKLPLLGVSLSSSFATPFRFFEPLELARFLLNQTEAGEAQARRKSKIGNGE